MLYFKQTYFANINIGYKDLKFINIIYVCIYICILILMPYSLKGNINYFLLLGFLRLQYKLKHILSK